MLLSIAGFEKLVLEDGAHKAIARLKLLFCSACKAKGDDYHYLFELHADEFEIVAERGHLGCGFIPDDMLVKLLGGSRRAHRVCAVQVRFFNPSIILA